MRNLFFVCFICLPFWAVAADITLENELMYRINFGSAEDVHQLLNKGANPNYQTPEGETPLSLAIDRNDNEAVAMVAALLEKGANPNQAAAHDRYPLISAVKAGQGKMVEALVAKGADVRTKSKEGTPVIELAKAVGKPEVIQPIQAVLDKEASYAASLRTPERFKDIVSQYTYQACIYQYWNYVFLSRQEPEKEKDIEVKTASSKETLAQLAKQIQLYYPSTKKEDIQTIGSSSATSIYTDLDGLISNRNRAAKGVGSDADATSRCRAISDKLPVNFLPQGMK